MFLFLRNVPLFSDLEDDDLDRLCQMIEEVRLPKGEVLFAEGEPGDRAYIIKEGELEIFKLSAEREVLLAVRGSGEVIGEMALLEQKPRTATVRALSDVVLLAIQKEQLDELLSTSITAANALYRTLLMRWRNTNAMLQQNEKMAQLGTLTAGVAHELNNPAAAVSRGAGQLQAAFEQYTQAQIELSRLPMDNGQMARLEQLSSEIRERAGHPPEMDALARSDRQDELENWLEEHGIDEAWDIAPNLVNLQYDTLALETLAEQFSESTLLQVIRWMCAAYLVYNLLMEVIQGAGRLSEIVKALKSYTYLDQAPVQAVNIHEGIDNTLLILQYKLKGISVRREYSPDLPVIQGHGSELNQVWTNIIDNAIDALKEQGDGHPGQIIIRTGRDRNGIIIEFEDNGPGIPPEVQPRIFDPFFTTKPVGKGSGLGLDISYRIVVDKHRGDIKVFSQPGKTVFQVWLPVNS